MDDEERSAPEPAARRLEVRRATAADDGGRDALVRATPSGTFFHLSGWRRVVQHVYGHAAHELVAVEGDEIVGVLPLMLYRGKDLLRVNLLSTPYAVYGGPVGRDAAVTDALLGEAIRLAEELRVGHLEIRFSEGPVEGFLAQDLYCTFRRDLPDEPAQVLAQMPKKARAEARKARKKHGLELSCGGWYADDLYRLFVQNKHALGSPSLPARHFQAIQEEFGKDVYVHLVRAGRMPLAAVMSFGFGKELVAYYSGTAPGADRSHSASNFMYMALQEWAVENGFEVFDFCRSRIGSGAFDFKRHQGFEPTPLHYGFHLVRHREMPNFTPSNPATRPLRAMWARMPEWVTRRVSETAMRFIP